MYSEKARHSVEVPQGPLKYYQIALQPKGCIL